MENQTQYTRCPHCQTAFKVSEKMLAMAKGKVRCGACLAVFQATDHLLAAKAKELSVQENDQAQVAEQELAEQELAKQSHAEQSQQTHVETQEPDQVTFEPTQPESILPESIQSEPTRPESIQPESIQQQPLESNSDQEDETANIDSNSNSGSNFDTNNQAEHVEPTFSEFDGEEFDDDDEPEVIPLDPFALTESEEQVDRQEQVDKQDQAETYIASATEETIVDELLIEEQTIEEPEFDESEVDVEKNAFEEDMSSESMAIDELSESENVVEETPIQEPSMSHTDDGLEGAWQNDDFSFDDEVNDDSGAERSELNEPEHDEPELDEPELNEPELDELDELFDSHPEDELQNEANHSPQAIGSGQSEAQTEEKGFEELAETLTHQMQDADTTPDPLDEFEERVEDKKTTLRTIVIAAVISIALIVLCYKFWQNKQAMAWDETWGGVTKSICSILPCDLKPRRDVDKIALKQKIVTPSETTDESLDIKLLLTNEAKFDQPYPRITIKFSNSKGEVVSTQQYEVSDYFPDQQDRLMPAATEVHIHFIAEFPHPDALGFEFIFD